MLTAENGKTVASSAAQTARFMWMLLARRTVSVSASIASNVIRNSGCGKRKDVNFYAWRCGVASMKSARIGGFAVMLAAAAGVGSTAITPNAAQNAEKPSSR